MFLSRDPNFLVVLHSSATRSDSRLIIVCSVFVDVDAYRNQSPIAVVNVGAYRNQSPIAVVDVDAYRNQSPIAVARSR